MLLRLLGLLSTLLVYSAGVYYPQAVKNVEVHASKGRFMMHMLHSAYFYRNTVNVKWSASAKGKPNLPFWLHLFPSRHRGIAYLIGTPITPLHQIVIHVIALSLDTYEKTDQYVTFMLSDDVRYNATTQQIVEIRVKNVEAEEFVNPHSDQIKRLERSIHETFRGKGVNPYIYSIYPEHVPDQTQELQHYYKPLLKSGSIIQIGTQASFHPNVINLMNGLRNNPQYCTQSSIIPLNKHFQPAFEVDWCQFSIRNVTQSKSTFSPSTNLLASSSQQQLTSTRNEALYANKKEERLSDIQEFNKQKKTSEKATQRENVYNMPQSYYFWQTVFIFPVLAAFCICLIFILSLIFFGRREGQQWRDFKTTKEQLHEYLNVRESQRHLRELSVQRQVLLSPNRSKSGTPLGVQDFLRSKENSPATKKRNPISESQSRLNPPTPTTMERRINNTFDDGSNERLPPRSSIGKQTVAEAAALTHSNLNLYRNPLAGDDLNKNEY